MSAREGSGGVWRSVEAIAIAALAVRAILHRDLPALVTADSWDYLQAAGDIYYRGDFFGPALGFVRLPGYPTLLALTYPLTQLRSDYIVLVQSALGLVSAAFGWAIGRQLGSRLVSIVMAAFLALNPVYLLSEHAVMNEAVSLTLYVGLVLAGIAALRPTAGWLPSVALGVFLGLSTVTRANALAMGATLAVASSVLQWRNAGRFGWSGADLAAALRRLRPALLTGVVALALVAPWLWRNWSAYRTLTIFHAANRNLVMYKNMHDPLDGSAPTLAAVNQTLGYDAVDWTWWWKLNTRYDSNEAESIARRIVAEQISRHPWQHARQVVESVAGFLGFMGFQKNERTGTLFMFRVMVAEVSRMNALAMESPSAPLTRDWSYVPRGGNTAATRLFARAGSLYLLPGRPIAFMILLGMLTFYLARRAWRFDARFAIVVVLSIGYAATVAMHAVALSDFDRYACMFDFVLVLIATLVVDGLRAPTQAGSPLR